MHQEFPFFQKKKYLAISRPFLWHKNGIPDMTKCDGVLMKSYRTQTLVESLIVCTTLSTKKEHDHQHLSECFGLAWLISVTCCIPNWISLCILILFPKLGIAMHYRLELISSVCKGVLSTPEHTISWPECLNLPCLYL